MTRNSSRNQRRSKQNFKKGYDDRKKTWLNIGISMKKQESKKKRNGA